MPIRRLSQKLNRKINADTVVEQLGSFRIDKFENRKDEVGLLYNNLTRLHDQIIHLFNDKERFAADVSHELKNPIASIIANSDNAIYFSASRTVSRTFASRFATAALNGSEKFWSIGMSSPLCEGLGHSAWQHRRRALI